MVQVMVGVWGDMNNIDYRIIVDKWYVILTMITDEYQFDSV